MIVSGLNDPRTIRALLDGGARGYIPKLASSEQLMDALRRVLRGEVYLPDALFIPDSETASSEEAAALTARQLQILPLLAGACPTSASRTRSTSPKGPSSAPERPVPRLNASNRTQAVKKHGAGLLRK